MYFLINATSSRVCTVSSIFFTCLIVSATGCALAAAAIRACNFACSSGVAPPDVTLGVFGVVGAAGAPGALNVVVVLPYPVGPPPKLAVFAGAFVAVLAYFSIPGICITLVALNDAVLFGCVTLPGVVPGAGGNPAVGPPVSAGCCAPPAAEVCAVVAPEPYIRASFSFS